MLSNKEAKDPTSPPHRRGRPGQHQTVTQAPEGAPSMQSFWLDLPDQHHPILVHIPAPRCSLLQAKLYSYLSMPLKLNADTKGTKLPWMSDSQPFEGWPSAQGPGLLLQRLVHPQQERWQALRSQHTVCGIAPAASLPAAPACNT